MSDTLNVGDQLTVDQSLTSANGAYSLTLQGDGNVVIIDGGATVWATGTDGRGGERLAVQEDGNVVLYTADNGAVWATGTNGNEGARLVLQDNRDLVVFAGDRIVWSTGEIPAEAPVEAQAEAAPEPVIEEAAPAAPAPRTHVVADGETLWAIAEQYLGDGNRYGEIAAASGIDNPDLINVGQVLTIP